MVYDIDDFLRKIQKLKEQGHKDLLVFMYPCKELERDFKYPDVPYIAEEQIGNILMNPAYKHDLDLVWDQIHDSITGIAIDYIENGE
jgi:hypothetical protein